MLTEVLIYARRTGVGTSDRTDRTGHLHLLVGNRASLYRYPHPNYKTSLPILHYKVINYIHSAPGKC